MTQRLPNTGDVLVCPYPSCGWTYVVPTELESLPHVNLRLSTTVADAASGFAAMFTAMHAAALEAQEASIRAHLDADHPGWTYDEVERLSRAYANEAARNVDALEGDVLPPEQKELTWDPKPLYTGYPDIIKGEIEEGQ